LDDPQIVVAVVQEAAGGGGAQSAPFVKNDGDLFLWS
jgi:cell division protein FtsI/penicillin-binding protein 2